MINAGTTITPLLCSLDLSIMFIFWDKPYWSAILPWTRISRHNLMLSDCIMAATFAQVQRQSAEMTWCHDVMVWLSCHLTWSHRGSWTPQIYLITAISIVSDDSSVSVLFDHLLAPAITLSSVQSTLVSALDPLLPPTLLLLATPSQLIASPVSQWTTPLSAQRLQFLILKNRCCFPRRPSQISNLESGPLSVV